MVARAIAAPLTGMPVIFTMYACEKPSIIEDCDAHENNTEAKILLCG